MPEIAPNELLALGIAIAFAAGLNLSAVVLTLGLLAQADLVTLPGSIAVVGEWWVIAIAAVLFVVEFFADKIPAFDLVWNALLTFIRVPAGAVLAFAATESLSPGMQVVAALAGAAVAAAAHGAKLALRSSVTPSPEPVSNVALSLAEDGVAVGLTWFAVAYPLAAAAVVLVLVVATAVVIRVVWLAMATLFRGAARQWSRDGSRHAPPGRRY